MKGKASLGTRKAHVFLTVRASKGGMVPATLTLTEKGSARSCAPLRGPVSVLSDTSSEESESKSISSEKRPSLICFVFLKQHLEKLNSIHERQKIL